MGSKPEPVLMYPAPNGELAQEFIPDRYWQLAVWLREAYLGWRLRHGKDIYYWHMRHVYGPVPRKIEDLKFMLHVQQEHDGHPTDMYECKQYKKLHKMYGNELAYFQEQLSLDSPRDRKTRTVTLGHPYAAAYERRWLRIKQWVPEEKMAYHGVSPGDWYDLLEMLADRQKKFFAADKRYIVRQATRLNAAMQMARDELAAEDAGKSKEKD